MNRRDSYGKSARNNIFVEHVNRVSYDFPLRLLKRTFRNQIFSI